MNLAKRTSITLTNNSQKLWSCLNGVFCIYKPAAITAYQTRMCLMANICRDLNNMKVRRPEKRVAIEYNADLNKYSVEKRIDLADHVLVVGDRYQPNDILMSWSSFLGRMTSGVMLMGIGRGGKSVKIMRENRPVRVFHITGKFGASTENYFYNAPITARATFDHISSSRMNSYLASLQASHQKKMFELCGVNLQSQAAYELAAQGPLRPQNMQVPLVYSLRCIEFAKPYFTIEVHACNESESYLSCLIHELGIDLKSFAHCTQIRCIRESHFTLDDALVKRHWNVETILPNIKRCGEIIIKHPELLYQRSPTLREMDEK